MQFLTEMEYNTSAELNPERNLATLVVQARDGLDPDKSRKLEEKGVQDASRRKGAYGQMERPAGVEPRDRP